MKIRRSHVEVSRAWTSGSLGARGSSDDPGRILTVDCNLMGTEILGSAGQFCATWKSMWHVGNAIAGLAGSIDGERNSMQKRLRNLPRTLTAWLSWKHSSARYHMDRRTASCERVTLSGSFGRSVFTQPFNRSNLRNGFHSLLSV